MRFMKPFYLAAAPVVLTAAIAAGPAWAADSGNAGGTQNSQSGSISTNHKSEVQSLLKSATAEVQTMKQNPQLKQLLEKAKGVFLVPEFGRGALIVGGRGGAGVVLAKNNGKWSDPAFYDFGAISLGLQAGGSGGKVAFLLMTDNAIDAFKSGNKISLNAGAGLTIVDFSHNGQASWGKGDIIMWTDNSGAYAGATVSVTDLNWADNNNQAYYGRKVQPDKILAGDINTPDATTLKGALAG
jgi:lipid-binding SYLF domain-containing protein